MIVSLDTVPCRNAKVFLIIVSTEIHSSQSLSLSVSVCNMRWELGEDALSQRREFACMQQPASVFTNIKISTEMNRPPCTNERTKWGQSKLAIANEHFICALQFENVQECTNPYLRYISVCKFNLFVLIRICHDFVRKKKNPARRRRTNERK